MSRIIWNAKEFLKKAGVVVDKVAAEGADMVLKDARRILMSKAKAPTGKTASEIEVKKSKFDGYIVQSKYPGIHIELGTSDTGATPFLRPALHKNKRRIHKRFQAAMK